MENEKINAVRDLLLKYLLPDALKPEYDGMYAKDLARKVVELIAEYDKSTRIGNGEGGT